MSYPKEPVEFLSFDMAMAKVCSKPCDKFQWMVSIGVLLGICSYDFILFSMQFLEMYPHYECNYDEDLFHDSWIKCERKDICKDIEMSKSGEKPEIFGFR